MFLIVTTVQRTVPNVPMSSIHLCSIAKYLKSTYADTQDVWCIYIYRITVKNEISIIFSCFLKSFESFLSDDLMLHAISFILDLVICDDLHSSICCRSAKLPSPPSRKPTFAPGSVEYDSASYASPIYQGC